MGKIYIEVSGGLVQNVYSDSDDLLDVVVCDYDSASAEEENDGYDFQATKACEELEENLSNLTRIW